MSWPNTPSPYEPLLKIVESELGRRAPLTQKDMCQLACTIGGDGLRAEWARHSHTPCEPCKGRRGDSSNVQLTVDASISVDAKLAHTQTPWQPTP